MAKDKIIKVKGVPTVAAVVEKAHEYVLLTPDGFTMARIAKQDVAAVIATLQQVSKPKGKKMAVKEGAKVE